MKHATMKILYTLILFLLAGSAYGQSNLPACQGDDRTQWHNCFGTTFFGNEKYVGQFKKGKPDGQGTYNWIDGEKYEGNFIEGKIEGIGTYYYNSRLIVGKWYKEVKIFGEFKSGGPIGQIIFYSSNVLRGLGEFNKFYPDGRFIWYRDDGSVERSGIFKNGQLVTSQYIDPNSFNRISSRNTASAVSESLNYAIDQRDKKIKEDSRQLAEEKPTLNNNNQGVTEIYQSKLDRKLDNPNKLPPCPSDTNLNRSNCWGSLNGYTGEFQNDNFNGLGQKVWIGGETYIGQWRNGWRYGAGITIKSDGTVLEGIWSGGQLLKAQKVDLPSLIVVHSLEKQQLQTEEIRRPDEDNRQIEQVKLDKSQREQAITTQSINLQVNNSQPNAEGDVTFNIKTNADTASLKVNGEEQGGRADGNYTLKRVARAGQETRFEIYAKDVYGNADTKTITVSRTVVESKVTYPELNPERIKRQPERDAVAIIIGISNYKSLPKADYAKDDAQVFFDYAIRALGVKPGNIKLLMDEQADAEEIYTAFKTWLPARVKSTTDVYVFYSGHGLPTQDGSGLYWLPQRANRDLLSKTAILLNEINSDIQASKPKSVTIFMDACYSGQARSGETLVASARPIALKSQPTTFPSNFTVISASQADQISSSSPELQHGIFSYYLMRGMEGEADLNKDGKITLDEIQKYLSENVGRQARIMNRQQEPQVIGDGSRVLVGR